MQPGLLRINKDYGWLRAADVMAEGDPALLTGMAEGTHAIADARRQAWRLEESLWTQDPPGPPDAGTLALVREQKEIVRDLVDRRKQLGFPVPDGCQGWWTEYEAHLDARPEGLPPTPCPPSLAGLSAAPLRAAPEGADQTDGPPSQPRRRKTTTRRTAAASSTPIPST